MRPLRSASIAALRFCGVTPPLARIVPASLVFSSASAEQQPLDGDEAVAGLLAGLLGRIKGAGELGRQIDLPGTATADLRHLVQGVLGRLQNCTGIAAGAVDQTGSQPSLSSSRTFRRCRVENCWCPSRITSDCADWMKPLERSVYLSMFMSFLSLGLPSEP